ncbi:hypothetical protein [Denitrobaculum tricleocarpae]|uniref:hypothetical protein n=1 Tax=Denitrobaculum tricleocarpae TaxID=2591009 RepID=UPI0015D3BD92|nr:hypothetical protein [Denitrobaculum tricleocarpae]
MDSREPVQYLFFYAHGVYASKKNSVLDDTGGARAQGDGDLRARSNSQSCS